MKKNTLSKLDKKIIGILQDDLPIIEEPYKALADKLQISEDLLLNRIQHLMATKTIRKISAVLRHRRVGFTVNALVLWQCPADRIDSIANNMVRSPAITHCYERETTRDWQYNLYTMIHTHSQDECENIVQTLGETYGITKWLILYTKHEWKKVSMRYLK